MNSFQAILDFQRARRKAAREQFRARLTGRSADLLSFDQVRQKLRAKSGRIVGLQSIPLDAIVGSVGRYQDFTRSFLPLSDDDQHRWARVQEQTTSLSGLPPVEVYQIGEVYFVYDGNHRVSVARESGTTHIQAYVTELESRVPITPDIQPDDLSLKAEYAEFMDQTLLDEIRPDANLSVTVPGQYHILLEHIQVHHYYMGLEQQKEIPYPEAVAHWYDWVYLPVVQVTRDEKILDDFPGRTETDLYLWMSAHQAALEKRLGWEIGTDTAATTLAEEFSPRPQRRFARAASRLLDALTPDELEAGPSSGQWRQERADSGENDCLFRDILVPVHDQDYSWAAVAQAAEIACRESARLLGLHIVRSTEEAGSERIQALADRFDRQCETLGIPGRLAIQEGKVARVVCDRSRWADLIVVGLAHPPASGPVAKLGSGFHTLIRRCPAPILAVPNVCSPMDRPLLAYDGSPKAKEALYVATYLASRGRVPLTVVSVVEGGRATSATLTEAADYLEKRDVQATLIEMDGPVAKAILEAAQEYASNLILMGGYGYSPVVEVVLGSAVDGVLRASQQPVLICR